MFGKVIDNCLYKHYTVPGEDGKQRERDYRCVFQCLLVQSRAEIVNERDNYSEELSGVLCLSGGGDCDTERVRYALLGR